MIPTTAAGWTDAAARMQRRADIAAAAHRTKEVIAYCRRRNYCARKAQELGGKPWDKVCDVLNADLVSLEGF